MAQLISGLLVEDHRQRLGCQGKGYAIITYVFILYICTYIALILCLYYVVFNSADMYDYFSIYIHTYRCLSLSCLVVSISASELKECAFFKGIDWDDAIDRKVCMYVCMYVGIYVCMYVCM